MRVTAGEFTELAAKACEDEIFKGVTLHSGRVQQFDQKKFFECLCENLKKRMYTTSASRLSTPASYELNEKKYFDFMEELNILDPLRWPEEYEITFGDNTVKKLCSRFNFDAKLKQKSVDAFRMAAAANIDNGVNLNSYNDLAPLLNVINTLIISTAECERSFSVMNDILTQIRNAMSVKTVQDSHIIFFIEYVKLYFLVRRYRICLL